MHSHILYISTKYFFFILSNSFAALDASLLGTVL